MSDSPERTGRYLARWSAHNIPYTRPERPVPLDLDAIREWNEANRRARIEYHFQPFINGRRRVA